MRLVSGVQPVSALHLGHYLGALRDQVSAQNDNDCYYFVADYHALTNVRSDPRVLQEEVLHVATAYLACGLDPDISALYRQSDVPEVGELYWILTTMTPLGLLDRATSFKSARVRSQSVDAGLYMYPVLQAADVLLLGGEEVPVGQDQLQHIEICRDIARRFNSRYGDVLTIPVPRLTSRPFVPGTNGEKMSRIHSNTIDLFATDDAIRARVNQIDTDSISADAPKVADTNTVYYLYKLIASESDAARLADRFTAGVRYSEAKATLADALIELTRDLRERYDELSRDRSYVLSVLGRGAERARTLAVQRMDAVRRACGFGTPETTA